jgi:two-component system, LuxR family, response regulator FixJ
MMSRTDPLILIVEHDSAVLASLNFMLEVEGFKTCSFNKIIDVLEAPRLPEIACLVLNFHMPSKNGIELLKDLRARQILAPAVLIIEYLDKTVRQRALAAGFCGVVDKTILHVELVDEIRRVLATPKGCHPATT